jgi:hypothetical protein
MTGEKKLVLFPVGAISAKEKERMAKAGFLAVEAIDPDKAALLEDAFPAQDLFYALLEAIDEGLSGSNDIRSLAMRKLRMRLLQKEVK